MESAMTHTGDIFEARARAARHAELRRLAGAISSLLFRKAETAPAYKVASTDLSASNNDQGQPTIRAA
jgi:hypothetical protein